MIHEKLASVTRPATATSHGSMLQHPKDQQAATGPECGLRDRGQMPGEAKACQPLWLAMVFDHDLDGDT